MNQKVFTAFQLIAGASDTATGALLLIAPAFTLRMMGVHRVVAEPIFISFIGVFVFSIGVSYLLFLVPPRTQAQISAVRAVWLITANVRLCVAFFVGAACFAGRLESAWLAITVFDFSVAVFQLAARQKLFVAVT